MKLILHNHELVAGMMSRHHILNEIIAPYFVEHKAINHLKTLNIHFEEYLKDENGMRCGGLQSENHIWIETRGMYKSYLSIFSIVQLMYHELAHMRWEISGQRAASAKEFGEERAGMLEESSALSTAKANLINWAHKCINVSDEEDDLHEAFMSLGTI